MTLDPALLAPLAAALARAGLPVLAQILGAAAPFPFSLFVGPAFSAVAAALGEDPATTTPQNVAAKVDAAPADAAAKLQPIESQHAAAVAAARDELAARLKDVADARATEAEYIEAGSALEWGAPAISAIAVAGFFVICGMMLFHVGDPSISQGILGAMTVGWTTVLTYWCGSSKGSADKTGELASIARQAAGASPPAPRRR